MTRAHSSYFAIVAIGLSLATTGLAADPPPGSSFAAAVDRAREAASRWPPIESSLGRTSLAPQLEPCLTLEHDAVACGQVDVSTCRQALRSVFDALSDETPDERHQRALLGAALYGLAEVVRASEAGQCPRTTAAGLHAAELALGDDGRTLYLRATPPLRSGRRYALEVSNAAGAELEALRRSVKPGGPPEHATTYARIARTSLADVSAPVDIEKLSTALTRWEADAAVVPGLSSDVALRTVLPARAAAAVLERLQFAFVPEDRARPERVLVTFRTPDTRDGLRSYRERLESEPCRAVPLLAVHEQFLGTVPALDIAGDDDGSFLGVEAGRAETTNVPIRFLRPGDATDATPLVLLVPGHEMTAADMLAAHGPALAARGMAALAIDLPEQGARVTGGGTLLDVLDPGHLTLGLRQAAADVLAVARAARRCGFRLPDGTIYRPTAVRYFGFSLGAMVGTMVRSVSPDLGTTVLVAPGAGIARWLKLRILTEFGVPLVSCSSGPNAGQSCLSTGRCPPPGLCRRDPTAERVWTLIEPPYARISAGADPLTFATETTGDASSAPLLVVTGGEDAALHPELATRLADAYRMKPHSEHARRGSHSEFVQWPNLGHDLLEEPAVRRQVYDFLDSRGRSRPTR